MCVCVGPPDGDKSGAPRKRRKSTSATPLSRVGSPSTLLKPPLTERQQMALLLQMTDPNKQGSSACEWLTQQRVLSYTTSVVNVCSNVQRKTYNASFIFT